MTTPKTALPAGDQQILDFYRTVLDPAVVQRYDRTDGWFVRYCGSLAQPGQGARHLRAIRSLLGLGPDGASGLRVLEIGSGFGLTCTTLAMLGARSVAALDANRGMVDTMRAYLDAAAPELPVKPEVGMAFDLPYPDGSFDRVLIVEALSHFIHHERCLREAYRVLAPGGLLVISDDNNALNPGAVAQTREVWERFEKGPPTDDIHGHRVRVPYVARRRRIIEEVLPAADAATLDRLAEDTCYMVRGEIEAACKAHAAGGPAPASRFRPERCPVEPEAGELIENLIDPVAVGALLSSLGAQVRLEAYFGGESRGGLLLALNRLANQVLPQSMLFARAHGFRVRARKPG